MAQPCDERNYDQTYLFSYKNIDQLLCIHMRPNEMEQKFIVSDFANVHMHTHSVCGNAPTRFPGYVFIPYFLSTGICVVK